MKMNQLAGMMAVVFVAVAAVVGLTGCAVGLAGVRVGVATPFSNPNYTFDSLGVNNKNSKAGGATFAGVGSAGESAAATADGTKTGAAADQIIQVGSDASNTRATDTGMAKEGSTAGGSVGGDQNPSQNYDKKDSREYNANVGPGSGTDVQTGGAEQDSSPGD